MIIDHFRFYFNFLLCRTMISTQFRDLQEMIGKLVSPELSPIVASKADDSARTNETNQKNESAAEIVTRISKMRQAVTAIERQLDTQVLANKKYEKLDDQRHALEIVRHALEKLRPTIKKTAKDLEVLTGCLSVEYLEKIVGLSEKLRDEWQQVNQRYNKRHVLWVTSKERYDTFFGELQKLEQWMEHAERVMLNHQNLVQAQNVLVASQEHIQIEKQVSEKNKEVTSVALLGKEIMGDTSAQEYVEIQTTVDKLLKRWKFVLSTLAAERDRLNKEKYVNNVNFINRWIESNVKKISSHVNCSSADEISDAITILRQYDTELVERDRQVEKLCSSTNMLSADVIHNLRKNYEHVVKLIPKRIEELNQDLERLNSLHERARSADEWVRKVAIQLDSVKRRPKTQAFMDIKNAIEEKMDYINSILSDYGEIVHRVASHKFTLAPDLRDLVTSLETQWRCLCSDCRQNLSRHQLSQKTTTFVAQSVPVVVEVPRDDKVIPELIPAPQKKKSATVPAPEDGQKAAPQVFASLRDHRDWIRRKSTQLSALSIAGDVPSLQKQVDEHDQLR